MWASLLNFTKGSTWLISEEEFQIFVNSEKATWEIPIVVVACWEWNLDISRLIEFNFIWGHSN